MLLFKPQIDRKFCDFCRDLDVIFFTFWVQKFTALLMTEMH